MQISQLIRDGYTILKNVFNKEQLQDVCSLIDEVIEYAEKDLIDPFKMFYLGHRPDQGVLYDLYQRHPEFRDMAQNKIILDTLQQVLGEDIFIYENSMVYKPKGKRNGVPWHQDFISRRTEPIKYIVWIALDKITKDNGCLKVIPGSHRLGFLPWHTVKGETHHDRVNKEYVDESKAEYVELEVGDVLIFHMLLLHSSDEVHTDVPRRAFRISYQGFDQIYSPRATPIVVRGGKPKSLASRFSLSNNNYKKILDNMDMQINKEINLDFISFLFHNPQSKVAIFGASDSGKFAYHFIDTYNRLFNANVIVPYFLDNAIDKNETYFCDLMTFIPNLELLNNVEKVILASSAYREITLQLISIGLESERLLTIFY
ncbi:phytanoyl-CoA dioxygenase family protein [Aneurinibacillus sp. UBA3580]|jgi:phytanoyl-CoA hydroxylase|uniref:phytanoyl-CoA dioxygenase family protein n=1 Tax=Aneurinibacillus sp. UBA3580 TaxID=1946041 RepID=UPI00257F82C6|nr:phytanoyl-CoA dioxygenase family protein [Aneurinibacillus sp. UBA3580]